MSYFGNWIPGKSPTWNRPASFFFISLLILCLLEWHLRCFVKLVILEGVTAMHCRLHPPTEGHLPLVGEEGYPFEPLKHHASNRVTDRTPVQGVSFVLLFSMLCFMYQSVFSVKGFCMCVCSNRGKVAFEKYCNNARFDNTRPSQSDQKVKFLG